MANRFGGGVTNYRNKILSWGGPQIPSRYVVMFRKPGSDTVDTFYPESISLPTRAFNVTPFSFWGPDYLIPSRRDYGECAMSFIMWSDNYERRYFETWMDNVITTVGQGGSTPGIQNESGFGIIPDSTELGDPVVNTNSYSDVAFPYFSFSGSIWIGLLNEKAQSDRGFSTSKVNSGFFLEGAYPTTITSTNLAAEANSYGTFVVVFSFRKYET